MVRGSTSDSVDFYRVITATPAERLGWRPQKRGWDGGGGGGWRGRGTDSPAVGVPVAIDVTPSRAAGGWAL